MKLTTFYYKYLVYDVIIFIEFIINNSINKIEIMSCSFTTCIQKSLSLKSFVLFSIYPYSEYIYGHS